jgi:hypothetical protein
MKLRQIILQNHGGLLRFLEIQRRELIIFICVIFLYLVVPRLKN